MIVVGYTADEFGRAALGPVLPRPSCGPPMLLVVNSTAGDSYCDARSPDHRREVAQTSRVAPDCGVEFEMSQPVGVDAAEELLAAMDRPEAELLVIGIRHRNPVGKLLLGSVSQQLILECPKPVLAVKPDLD